MTMMQNNPMTQKKIDYTKDKLKKALVSVGIKKGDIVFCQLGLSKLGVPKEIYEGKSKFDVIYEAITETQERAKQLLSDYIMSKAGIDPNAPQEGDEIG